MQHLRRRRGGHTEAGILLQQTSAESSRWGGGKGRGQETATDPDTYAIDVIVKKHTSNSYYVKLLVRWEGHYDVDDTWYVCLYCVCLYLYMHVSPHLSLSLTHTHTNTAVIIHSCLCVSLYCLPPRVCMHVCIQGACQNAKTLGC